MQLFFHTARCFLLAVVSVVVTFEVSVVSALEPVEFKSHIAPILAARCYECHGPDEQTREAGLRLDDRDTSMMRLDSGAIAIVPNDSEKSEVIRRILAADDERMPPVDTNDALTGEQIELIRRWIDEGAEWQGHWAFEPLDRSTPPRVDDRTWSRNPIDQFVLAKLEEHGLGTSPVADRYTLIRRLSFDLVGLPPSADEIYAYLNDDRPDAYERLVDRLLASPGYGERWGRHWLDVARYADSNGGDENHAYPLAHRFRDYVIQVVNDDLPYDDFVRQQLAGDLLDRSDDERLNHQQMTATGYLAIGMKILAEQDEDKKRADMVDEQIDTFGRTFLGLSLGCCRCHDHKFDPIPTRDYYALAGIFNSTEVSDQPLMSREVKGLLAEFESAQQRLQDKIDAAEDLITTAGNIGLTREAESFDRGNVVVDNDNYGAGIGIISDPGEQLNFAEYDFEFAESTRYVVQVRYAAESSRPGKILLNDEVVVDEAIAEVTGGWGPDDQKWQTEGSITVTAGKNVLRIESMPMMSHIDKVRLIKGEELDLGLLDEIDTLNNQLAELNKNRPTPPSVMGVADRGGMNSRVHVRGSHLDLGDEVPRGFLEVLDGKSQSISDTTSGRLQLANWLTENPVAARLASRVIVNRLWHWHFGRGLVKTPDDFGTRGQPPTHPRLLDYLAGQLIEHEWSLKAVNRMIVTSATYRMTSIVENRTADGIDPTNRWYWKRNRQRLDAESIRDALLLHSKGMAHEIGNAPMSVKSQDPSPQDMQQNLDTYEISRRRSVYLPVVRSNIYEFFTLFDFPNSSTPVGKRNETTIPTQALWLMNSPFLAKQAREIAKLALADPAADQDTARIAALYLKLFTRAASDVEVELGQSFVAKYRATVEGGEGAIDRVAIELDVWAAYCQVLLSANEYLYVH